MKKLVLAALMIAGLNANAKIMCAVYGENPNEKGSYDQEVMSAQDVTGQAIIIQGKKVTLKKFDDMAYQDWKAIDGATLVYTSKPENDPQQLIVSIGKVTASNLDELLQSHSTAWGSRALTLISEPNKVSVSCFRF